MIDKYFDEIDGKHLQKKYICVNDGKYNNQIFKIY